MKKIMLMSGPPSYAPDDIPVARIFQGTDILLKNAESLILIHPDEDVLNSIEGEVEFYHEPNDEMNLKCEASLMGTAISLESFIAMTREKPTASSEADVTVGSNPTRFVVPKTKEITPNFPAQGGEEIREEEDVE